MRSHSVTKGIKHQISRYLVLLLVWLVGCASDSGLPQKIPTASAPFPVTALSLYPSPTLESSDLTLPPLPTSELSVITVTPVSSDYILTPHSEPVSYSIGQSTEGRDIIAWQFGDGAYTVILVGGIHAGYEANTVLLAEDLAEHFIKTPDDILPGLRLIIIPRANPDGMARGRSIEGRFNANGVDLNRNWGCDWQEKAYLQSILVNPGKEPFSEVESRLLRDFFLQIKPAAVVFYHSAANGVFPGECNGNAPGAGWLGKTLSKGADYPLHKRFEHYDITGDATNWLAANNIPAIVVELATKDDPEFRQNLNGVIALQCYLALNNPGVVQSPSIQRLCH